jgi:hypothetical protein
MTGTMKLMFALLCTAVVIVAIWAAPGCGGNACDQASNKLTSCGLQSGNGGEGGATSSGNGGGGPVQLDCTAANQCLADCINAGTCQGIVRAYSYGGHGGQGGGVSTVRCFIACGQSDGG